jgi:hypothetical protein
MASPMSELEAATRRCAAAMLPTRRFFLPDVYQAKEVAALV